MTESLEKIRRGERADNIDTVRVRKDGRRIEVTSYVSPVKNDEGEVIGIAKVSYDISERKRNERVLRFLSEASSELATLVDYQSTMQRVASLAVPFFADWCIVNMIDGSGQIQRVAYAHADGGDAPLLQEFVERFPLSSDSAALSAQVLRSGKPQLLTELPARFLEQATRDDRARELLERLGPRSAVSVPIAIHNAAVGSLNFVTGASGRRYTPADLELAGELARRAAIAIRKRPTLPRSQGSPAAEG